MIHYGTLRGYKFPESANDIRGAELFGGNDEKLGEISDVIFDHSNGEIRYAVVDTGGWLKSKQFLVPADRLALRHGMKDNHYRINLTKAQIEQFPEYDDKLVATGDSIFNNEDLQHLRIEHKNANADAAYGGMLTEATGSESRAATSPSLATRLGRRWASFQDRLHATRHDVIKHCSTCEHDRLQNERRQRKDVA